MTGRLFCIGDVHGCTEELDALLAQLNLTAEDHVVFAGDLVDKGPDSAGVVRRVRELATKVKVDLTLGNHEELWIRWMAKDEKRKPDMKRHNEFVEIHKTMTDEDRDYLRTAQLYHKIPGGLVTHAGIPEYLRELPEVGPHPTVSRKVQNITKTMCRLRYVDDKGGFVGLNETNPEIHTFWAVRYGGQFGTVYFGHEFFLQDEPEVFPNAFGIDLGCVYGGWLCAIQIDEEGFPLKSYVEKARRQYADPKRGGE